MKVRLPSTIQIQATMPYLWFALAILTAKFSLIAIYGNATPYWDQWDAEADNLYRPWLEGTLRWSELFNAHNEHRILTTRLLALVLFEFNGRIWNPLLQMQINALLHVIALLILMFHLGKIVPTGYKNYLFIFATALFSIPFGWENTLAGFQSQFYFLLLFSFIFLWSMSAYKTNTIRWWIGVLTGLLSLVSLASGALVFFAGGLILVVRRWLSNDKNAVAIPAIILIMSIAVLFIIQTPIIQAHAALKAKTFAQFITTLTGVMSWPTKQASFGFLVIQLPLFVIVFMSLTKEEYKKHEYIFIVAMSIWLFGQFVSIAYGRAIGAGASRYIDIFAIGLVISFSILLSFVGNANSENRSRYILGLDSENALYRHRYTLGMAIWLTTVALGFYTQIDALREDLRTKSREGVEQENNVRAYLCSLDDGHLRNKPYMYLPYPNPTRLKEFLDNTTIRSFLPGNIYEKNAHNSNRVDQLTSCNLRMPSTQNNETTAENFTKQELPFATTDKIIKNDWVVLDRSKENLGFVFFHSQGGPVDAVKTIKIHLRRGDFILYRSGPSVEKHELRINDEDAMKFNITLPISLEWSVISFTNSQLPNEFDVSVSIADHAGGEWAAIALQTVKSR